MLEIRAINGCQSVQSAESRNPEKKKVLISLVYLGNVNCDFVTFLSVILLCSTNTAYIQGENTDILLIFRPIT